MAVSMKIDTRELDRNLRRLSNRVLPSVLLDAVHAAADQLLKDALPLVPYDPDRKTGIHLRDSGDVKVSPKHKAAWVAFGPKHDGPPRKGDPAHAHLVHEMPENFNFSTDGTGPKYLEGPLFQNMRNYLGIMAQVLRSGIRRGLTVGSGKSMAPSARELIGKARKAA